MISLHTSYGTCSFAVPMGVSCGHTRFRADHFGDPADSPNRAVAGWCKFHDNGHGPRLHLAWRASSTLMPSHLRKAHERGTAGQNPHLPDGNGVQLLDAFSLRQAHFDEFCIQTLNVRQHQKLLDGSAIPHIAFESGTGVAPLFGSLAKQSDVEKISFAGVGTSRLRSAHHSGDEVRLNRLGMDPVVEFGQRPVEIPRDGKTPVLVFLETLEVLNQV